MTTWKSRALARLAAHPRSKVGLKDLARTLRVESRDDFHALRDAVAELVREGKAEVNGQGKISYRKQQKQARKKLTGTLRVTRRGEGFVRIEGMEDEVHIASRFMRTALPGDTVAVALFARPARSRRSIAATDNPEGEITEVITRGTTRITGRVELRRTFAFVVPDDPRIPRDIYVDPEGDLTIATGDKVLVELLPWNDPALNPEGTVIEVLGPSGDARVEVLSVSRSFGLDATFPEDVERESAKFPSAIDADEVEHRLDLRMVTCVTIDPEDAQDFDDAVSLETLSGGTLRLGVHIADVSHYVREGSALDREALRRGTSVYLVNEVIPMLPTRLSNDLCSLRPMEDRLSYSVLMEITPDGVVTDYSFARSIIRSKRRFAYEEVQKILDRGKGEMAEMLLPLHALTKKLTERRMKNGSLDFETPEAKFRFDATGLPSEIFVKTRLDAHRLIEECMLLANTTVATHIGRLKQAEGGSPFIYRVHDMPNPDRLRDLSAFVKHLGYTLDVKEGVSSRELQKLLQRVKGTPEEALVSEVALRSMAKAVYASKNIGHFGLAFRHYTHFTSPIRRYPDLVVHRLLNEYAAGRVKPQRITQLRTSLPGIADQSSDRERVAMEAERASVRVMQMEYMKRHVGDEFDGMISGVTEFGLFVRMDDVLVEGLVHVRDLGDDYYLFDEKKFTLRGRSRGREYRLGDRIRVQVMAVNPVERSCDLAIAHGSKRRS